MIAEAALVLALLTPVTDWDMGSTEKWLPFYDKAPVWQQHTIEWMYNPIGEPTPLALGEIKAAAAEWAAFCGIKFVYKGIGWRTSTPGDKVNTVAWGIMDPAYAGYVTGQPKGEHIIESDMTLNKDMTMDLNAIRAIARHEWGHMIGIAHSDVEWAAMSGPPYSNYRWPYNIAEDDVKGCRALYGPQKMSRPLRWLAH